MARRLEYYFQETVSGLKRNGLVAFAAVSTVFVALFLFGWALLLTRQVNIVTTLETGNVEVLVYLQDNITPAEQTNIQTTLQGLRADGKPVVSSLTYQSKQQAYEEAKKLFANDPAIIRNVGPNAFPASFRVKLADPQQFGVVAASLTGQPGIEQIKDNRAVLHRLFSITNALRSGALIAGIVVLIASAALIANTVRMAIFARRKEIGIMKLVGATNWFIRIPFLIEGVVEGLLGAGVAILGLYFLKRVFVDPLRGQIKFFPLIQSSDLVATIPWLLVIGVAVALFASLAAMRRFLEV